MEPAVITIRTMMDALRRNVRAQRAHLDMTAMQERKRKDVPAPMDGLRSKQGTGKPSMEIRCMSIPAAAAEVPLTVRAVIMP